MEDKVIFGLENVYCGEYTEDSSGNVTMGTPDHLEGAVRMSQDPETEDVKFYADNRVYYQTTDDNGVSGELEFAYFPDWFKAKYLNYDIVPGGGIGQNRNKQNKKMYFVWEFKGDKQKRRGIMYNVSPGMINREYSTTENTKEPVTATLPYSCVGSDATGITKVAFKPGDTYYNSMFTSPPAPALPIKFKKSTDTTVSASKIYYTVEGYSVANPSAYEIGYYYEKAGTTYTLTEDTVINSNKTYYRLLGTRVASPSGNPSSAGYYEELSE